jgi:hypothetical protein
MGSKSTLYGMIKVKLKWLDTGDIEETQVTVDPSRETDPSKLHVSFVHHLVAWREQEPDRDFVIIESELDQNTTTLNIRSLLDGEMSNLIPMQDDRNALISGIMKVMRESDYVSLADGTTFQKTFEPSKGSIKLIDRGMIPDKHTFIDNIVKALENLWDVYGQDGSPETATLYRMMQEYKKGK